MSSHGFAGAIPRSLSITRLGENIASWLAQDVCENSEEKKKERGRTSEEVLTTTEKNFLLEN